MTSCDLVIVGGGVGGCAAALAATDAGLRVVMTEPTRWIGGQLTSQATPPDENPWIESYGSTASYRHFRELTRRYYRDHYRLSAEALADSRLNPGGGFVSHLCVEPRASLWALDQLLGKATAAGRLKVLLEREPVAVDMRSDVVAAVTVRSPAGEDSVLEAPFIIDATEGGDLLALGNVEHVTGAESSRDTGEPHAPLDADPRNVQAATWVFAMAWDARPQASHVGLPPADYEFWRAYCPALRPPWPGPLLQWTASHPVTLAPRRYSLFGEEAQSVSLFEYRKVRDARLLAAPALDEVTLVNWPQNDYLLQDLVTASAEQRDNARHEARQLSLSLLHWLQTEAPRSDGGAGYPGLYPAVEVTGTDDGLAMAPYIRESRRIRARLTVTELHVGVDARRQAGRPADGPAEQFDDSVGIGAYRIDLHPTTAGDNYVDIASLPFQIPLRACLPVRVRNLLPACKNIGTTHITNGCYRLHPVEWNIGESMGTLVAFCRAHRCEPADLCSRQTLLRDLQKMLSERGVPLAWGPCHAL